MEKCQDCGGWGYVAGHDLPERHGEDGECVSCPVQVECGTCNGAESYVIMPNNTTTENYTCLSLDCPERKGGKCDVVERITTTDTWEEQYRNGAGMAGDFDAEAIVLPLDNALFLTKLLLKEQISLAEQRGAQRVIEYARDYLEHSRSCILSDFEAGRPTLGGGYEQKFRGKWYQVRPVDNTPNCDCGLSEMFSKFLTNAK